jgi:uncharacterized repeat protein (TIGR01451 family)
MGPSAASCRRLLHAVASAAGLALALSASALAPASAATPAPGLTVHFQPLPTHFSTDEAGLYRVTVTNSGSLPTDGPITILDALPKGLTVHALKLLWSGDPSGQEGFEHDLAPENCAAEPVPALESQLVRCTLSQTLLTAAERSFKPDDRLQLDIGVTVDEGATSAPNTASVTEGSSPTPVASLTEDDVIASTPPPFGASAFVSYIARGDGRFDAQAGDHPYELTARIDLNTVLRTAPDGHMEVTSVHDLKDVVLDLPLGLIADAQATPKCTFAQLASGTHCPPDTRVGELVSLPVTTAVSGPIYNMIPEHGVPAEFGYTDAFHSTHAIYASLAPTPDGYLTRVTIREIPQVTLTGLTATFYGDPATKDETAGTPLALLTNPSLCTAQAPVATVHMDSWQQPGAFESNSTPEGSPGLGAANWVSISSVLPGEEAISPPLSEPLTGCNALRFTPTLFARPDTAVADSPTGLTADLSVPQSETPGTLATAPLRDATITLPAGVTINPSFANGLAACSASQIGWLGAGTANFNAVPPRCPDASTIGAVDVTTPLLAGAVHGSVYLAEPYANPFKSLLAAYVVIDDPTTGVLLKIAAQLETNPQTGRLTIRLSDAPQIPISDLKLRLFGGQDGVLATPQTCGTFSTTSDLQPSSAPQSGPDATPSDTFAVTSGCALAFAPSFSAGTVSNRAGAFSPLTLTIARQDGEQHLAGVTLTTPPGVLATLAGVPVCGETQANAGTCAAASQIGETTVSAGVGPNPFVAHGGRVYLTGPYNNGPFGLSVVVPAVVGPFNLGDVVIRLAIRVDPHTAQLTFVSDPLPRMIDSVQGLHSGIPADLRTLNITINRPGLMFNPTSCDPLSVTGAITSASGASAAVSNHFQAANCATLPFKPKLTALTRGNGEFTGHGASLHVVITTTTGQANIRSIKVALPQRLPARLGTIQHACPQRIFDANPATCPKASVIGSATVQTPVLAVPLAGPAYLVSHGGAAFPDIVLVLQSQGVRIDLTGALYVDAHNITSTTFRTIPDVPIRRLDLVLPEGRGSVLAASAGLCTKRPLVISYVINAQDNARVKHTVKVPVEGCKKSSRHKHKHHSTHRKRRQ